METQNENLLHVIIQNKVHVLPSVSNFQELKLAILSDFGNLTLEFIADDQTPSSRLNPKLFKRIEAVIDDKHTFEKHGKKGNCFRCTNCKKTLSTLNFVCRHDSKCRNISRYKHSLLSETLSSIEKLTESEKTNSSFLSISKDNSKIQANFQKNTSYSCFTQDSSHVENDKSYNLDSKE